MTLMVAYAGPFSAADDSVESIVYLTACGNWTEHDSGGSQRFLGPRQPGCHGVLALAQSGFGHMQLQQSEPHQSQCCWWNQ